jgi:hypothetical protein
VIVGLLLARTFGWLWMDPLAGIVGACVIASWSYGLIRDTGAILLDMNPDPHMADNLRQAVESEGDELADLHLWRLGPGHLGGIISVITTQTRGQTIIARGSPGSGPSPISPSKCSLASRVAVGDLTDLGRFEPTDHRRSNGRNRRNLAARTRPGEGPEATHGGHSLIWLRRRLHKKCTMARTKPLARPSGHFRECHGSASTEITVDIWCSPSAASRTSLSAIFPVSTQTMLRQAGSLRSTSFRDDADGGYRPAPGSTHYPKAALNFRRARCLRTRVSERLAVRHESS